MSAEVTQKHSTVALIPARSGSKRITDKNVRFLAGHPLLAYTVRAAIDSGIFDAVICATDSTYYADIASYYGAEIPFLRSSDTSGDKSPDIDWVLWMLKILKQEGREFDVFSILRPTSPFRLPETIQRAWSLFITNPQADSLRAIKKCKQHPGKMWVIRGKYIFPVMPFSNGTIPWHSNQYAALPEIYEQDASLEIAWSSVAQTQHSIAGNVVIPFLSQGLEGFDINDPEDWLLAEHYLSTGEGQLPNIKQPEFKVKIRGDN